MKDILDYFEVQNQKEKTYLIMFIKWIPFIIMGKGSIICFFYGNLLELDNLAGFIGLILTIIALSLNYKKGLFVYILLLVLASMNFVSFYPFEFIIGPKIGSIPIGVDLFVSIWTIYFISKNFSEFTLQFKELKYENK